MQARQDQQYNRSGEYKTADHAMAEADPLQP